MTASDKTIDQTIATAAQTIRESSTGWKLRHLSGIAEQTIRQQLAQIDIEFEQFMLLMFLLESPGSSQATLAKKSHLPTYSITRYLDVLVQKALVVREPDPNSRRSYCVYATDKAKQLVPDLFAMVTATNQQLLSGLDDDEQATLHRLLNKLLQSHA